MADFSNVKAYQRVNEARRYTFDEIQLGDGLPPVWLDSLPATQLNAPYHNEWLRRLTERREQSKGTLKVDGALMDASRAEDRELLARHCAQAWGNVVDAKGKSVEFSADEALQFMQALPDDVFDGYRAWVMTPANFRAIDSGKANQLGN